MIMKDQDKKETLDRRIENARHRVEFVKRGVKAGLFVDGEDEVKRAEAALVKLTVEKLGKSVAPAPVKQVAVATKPAPVTPVKQVASVVTEYPKRVLHGLELAIQANVELQKTKTKD